VRDVHELKGYLSRCTDAARMAYGRKRKLVPRQFIIIGTTNETTDYLKDSTGARRFWPVRIVEFDIARLRADRDQLWAEAAHCEAAGASIRLDPTLYPVAARSTARASLTGKAGRAS
jgi:predicted P-loop ATPase